MANRGDKGDETTKETTKLPSSRLGRLARLASMTADVSLRVASGAVKKVAGRKKHTTTPPRATVDNPTQEILDDELDLARTQEKLDKLLDTFMLNRAAAERIVRTLGGMKGLAMKLGQQLSMQADIMPKDIRNVILELCNAAEPMAWSTVRSVVEQELGGTIDELFASFEPESFAAASLGQVHEATLHDGTRVAVKIQYPGVDKALVNDLKNLGVIMKTVGFIGGKGKEAGMFHEEIARETERELDYRAEAANLARMAEALSPWDDLVVPRVIEERSSARVITFVYIEGPTLKDLADQALEPARAARIGSQLFRAVFGPFVRRRLIHGDPHPGNWIVTEAGKLAVLDFGIVKELPGPFVEAYEKVIFHEDGLEPGAVDMVHELEKSGFVFELDGAEARRVVEGIARIIGAPHRSDTYDFSDGLMVRQIRAFVLDNMGAFYKITPAKESLFFFRSAEGLAQNLAMIRAAIPVRALTDELLRG